MSSLPGVPETDVSVVGCTGEERVVGGVPRKGRHLLGVAPEDGHLPQRAHVVEPDHLVPAARQQQVPTRVPPNGQHRVLGAVPASTP